MKLFFHEEFQRDVARVQLEIDLRYPGQGARFLADLRQAVSAVGQSPLAAGHFILHESVLPRTLRRRNLRIFPFFIVYRTKATSVEFGGLVPTKSDPDKWGVKLRRLPVPKSGRGRLE